VLRLLPSGGAKLLKLAAERSPYGADARKAAEVFFGMSRPNL